MDAMRMMKVQQLRAVAEEKFRQENQFTDVLLECDGGNIAAHKLILCAASDYFYNMFQSKMIESYSGRVEFKSYSVQAMELVIKFLYNSCEVPLELDCNVNLLKEVISIAHLMQITHLFDYCWKTFESLLNEHNFVEMWDLAELYERRETQELVANFGAGHLSLLAENPNSQKLSIAQMMELIELAQRIHCTDQVVDFVFKWAKHQPENNRVVKASTLLARIDLEDMSGGYLCEILAEEPMLADSVELKEIFTNQATSQLEFVSTPSIQIHFMSRRSNGQNKIQTYCLKEKSWHTRTIPDNPTYPPQEMTRAIRVGHLFYLSTVTGNKLLPYNPNVRLFENPISLPNKFPSRILNYGCDIYLWNPEGFIQYNPKSRNIKSLSNISGDFEASKLMSVGGKIFLHDGTAHSLHFYDTKLDEWKLKTKIPRGLLSVYTQCCNRNCTGKMYFLKGEYELMSYDTFTNVWLEMQCPARRGHRAICANCDDSFILIQTYNLLAFWLYYPLDDKWEKLPDEFKFSDFVFSDIAARIR